jgi:hypothetical protein
MLDMTMVFFTTPTDCIVEVCKKGFLVPEIRASAPYTCDASQCFHGIFEEKMGVICYKIWTKLALESGGFFRGI